MVFFLSTRNLVVKGHYRFGSQLAEREGFLRELYIAPCKSPLCFGKEPFLFFVLLIDNSEKRYIILQQ